MKKWNSMKRERRPLIRLYAIRLSILYISFRTQIKSEEKKLAPGEKLSLDKITDIMLRVSREARNLSDAKSGTRN